jgi:hypothetical protein
MTVNQVNLLLDSTVQKVSLTAKTPIPELGLKLNETAIVNTHKLYDVLDVECDTLGIRNGLIHLDIGKL